MQIISYCVFPRGWRDIVNLTKKSEASLSVHINDLINMGLLDYHKEEHFYISTKKAKPIIPIYKKIQPLQKQIDIIMNDLPSVKKSVNKSQRSLTK